MASEFTKLLKMPKEQLDELYKSSSAGDIPQWGTHGVAIALPGSIFARLIACFVRLVCWQGKIFDSDEGALINKLSPLGIGGIKAKVYKDKSWVDGKETIVLDYSKTSFVAKKIRDEIREIKPGVYLGKVWWGKTPLIHFALVPESPDARLLYRSKAQLDELYKNSPAGDIPVGQTRGTAIFLPSTRTGRVLAKLARWIVWQGKIFDPDEGTLINMLTPLRFGAIKAQVYKDKSWIDDKETIVLDYAKTSFVAKKIRDEIRQVQPGLYLGKVWWGKKRLIDFALVPQSYIARTNEWPARIVGAAVIALLVAAGYLACRLNIDRPVTYASDEDHFKYGSTGGERASGIPYWVWRVLPELFPEHLPGPGYASLGFVFEGDNDLPVGVSKRDVQGVDRVFLNCAVCHVGTVRETPDSEPVIYTGMPANTFDLGKFQQFVFDCVTDEKFTPQRILLEIERIGGDMDWVSELAMRYFGIGYMRERLLMIMDRFTFVKKQAEWGPGRVDTFSPAKVLLGFDIMKLPERERFGVVDFPSIWLQRPRQGMKLHWDGNNTSVEERNRSASFGTGAFPPTLDRVGMKRIEDWLLDKQPPEYPFPINEALAAKGKPLYQQYCSDCHGQDGRNFEGSQVGEVVPIDKIATDRNRLDSYTHQLAMVQNSIYAGGEPGERFSHFRKTYGYVNMPLDGVWLRGPYLHNGSVPTLRDLLEPSANRPRVFYRGYDVYDQKRVGFVSNVSEEKGKQYSRFDTAVRGNGNKGHEGPAYGTALSPAEKDAIVEYLKTF